MSWLVSTAIHVAAYAMFADWWTRAEPPSLSGRRSVATIQLSSSAPATAGELLVEPDAPSSLPELSTTALDVSDPVVVEAPAPLVSVPLPAPPSAERQAREASPDQFVLPTLPVAARMVDRPRDAATRPRSRSQSQQPQASQPTRRGNAEFDALAALPSASSLALGLDNATPASPTRNPLPRYPAGAAARRIEGRVLLRVHITAEGTVASVEVVASTGHAELDQAAVNAVRQWTFSPARRAGRAVAWTTLLPVRFRVP